VPRATFSPDEICELTIECYKRNYIEGLFLSSAVFKNPHYTMELLVETVIKLRKLYGFNGYIHLKGIPSADRKLILRAGEFVDRMSFNIELPSEQSLKLLAPQKSKAAIIAPMKMLAQDKYFQSPTRRRKDFMPAGQTSQMIIGASPESDAHILKLTEYMYHNYKLKRVYFSTYTPTNFDTSLLPYEQAPLIREHRLYQADWLLRFYGFTADEITGEDGFLSTDYDPKCAWALKNPHLFPVEINTASPQMLLKIPGIGVKSAYRIMQARKYTKLDFDDLKRLRVVLKRAVHFITCKGKFIGGKNQIIIQKLLTSTEDITRATQLTIFDRDNAAAISALTGEL
jgi:putative DNA modification/repair radical SAM protein